jgi:hypothetical protein
MEPRLEPIRGLVEEKDVEVNVADNVLTIRGEKKAEKEQKDKDYRVVERGYGSFGRDAGCWSREAFALATQE